MTAPVFISYSSKDQKVARAICDALEMRGITCWIAGRDVGPGQNFQETIVRAIRAAKVMVLVLSANANQSPEVQKELALASQQKLVVIPARLEEVVLSEALTFELATRQWIDLFRNWEQEIERLTLWVEKTLTSPGPVPAPRPQRDYADQSWAMAAVFAIASVAALFVALLGGQTVWLLAVVPVIALLAMTLGLSLFRASDGASFSESLNRALIAIGLIVFVWIIFGYSLAFTGGNDFVGGFSRAFLSGLTTDARISTYTAGNTIPELNFVIFQGCVAAITSVLVVSVLGLRMRFAALICCLPLWATLVYFPLAHMAWYWSGADATSDAAKALAAANTDAAKAAAQARLDAILGDTGWLFKKGLLDYAGGTVVAINAGVTGLVGVYLFGGGNEPDRNSSRSEQRLGVTGLFLVWLAWLGLNAASDLDFGSSATRIAMVNCLIATGAAAAAGMMTEWLVRGRTSPDGVLYGALAGIIAITPAAAFAGTTGAAILAACAGAVTVGSVCAIRGSGYTALTAMALACLLNGTLGTLATGILVSPALGGTGIMDYTTGNIADYDLSAQMVAQLWGVSTTLVWSGAGSAIIYTVVDAAIGLQPARRKSA